MERPVTAGTLRRRAAERQNTDSGLTLIEVVVAMVILSIFMSLFLGAVISLTRGTTQVRAAAESTSGTLLVFQNIDRQVRYADAINYPGPGLSTGYRYIEFRTPASSTPTNETTCNQWRYLPNLKRIETRRWIDTPGSVPTAWSTKLTNVIDTPVVTYPFAMQPAASENKQKLLLTIDAGLPGTAAPTAIETVFVARNSSPSSVTNTAGPDGQSVQMVCTRTGLRP
jgi:prepilin-type N-terminal cleavage/methylation domain-containing protein